MKLVYILLSTAAIFALSSCEKVIDVELNEEDSQLAIEAPLYAGTHNFVVTLSATNSYFEASLPNGVNGAAITLSDDLGSTQVLSPIGNGQYESMVTATPGRTYSLQVVLGSVTYTAESKLLDVVPLDQLEPEFQEEFGPFPEGYIIYNRFNDPANEENYYRFRHWVNDTFQNEGTDIVVFDDSFFDGNYTRLPLINQIFDLHDTVEVEMIHFDKAAYEFYNALVDIVGDPNSGGSAAPGNPISNWNNNALGYFIAMSSDTVQIVVQ